MILKICDYMARKDAISQFQIKEIEGKPESRKGRIEIQLLHRNAKTAEGCIIITVPAQHKASNGTTVEKQIILPGLSR